MPREPSRFTACAIALAEPQLTLASAWSRLDALHRLHAGGATLQDEDHAYFMQEVEVPEGIEFSMTYVLPPDGTRFLILTPPPLPFLKDRTPFMPYDPGDHDGVAPWEP